MGKQLCQPRERRHIFNANADHRCTAKNHELRYRSGIACRTRREGVQQYAPDQHAAAPEEVYQIATEQAEDTTRRGRDKEEQPGPKVERGCPWPHVSQSS